MSKKYIDHSKHVCFICGGLPKNKKGKDKLFVEHHISYNPEIIILLCFPCHMWLHGQSRVYPNHRIKKTYGVDIGPYVFARRVVKIYESFNPEVVGKGEEEFAPILKKALMLELKEVPSEKRKKHD